MSAQPYQYAQPPPAGPRRTSAGRGLWISGIVVAAVGLVLAIVSAILLFSGVVSAVQDQLTAPLLDSQGTNAVSLEPGTYLVFQNSGAIPMSASDVTVSGPDGQGVAVSAPDIDERFNRYGQEFVAIAQFDAGQTGQYELTVAQSDTGTQLVVAPGLTSKVVDRAGWIFGILGGGLLVLVGLVLFAVGLTQRRRALRPAVAAADPSAAGYPPTYTTPTYTTPTYATPARTRRRRTPSRPCRRRAAGWYPDPDPSRPGGRRYWDGSTWTGHIA